MRKTTLLPTATGVLVGLNKIFVTFNAVLLTANVAGEVFVAVTPLAVAKFVAAPVAIVRNVTVMLVLWPGVNTPRFVHVNKPVTRLVVLGARLAETKLNLAVGKVSLILKLGKLVLPVLMACKLNVMLLLTPTCPPDGERIVLFITTPATPGGGRTVAVALVLSVGSVGSE